MFLIKAKILDKTYNLLTIEGKTSSKTTIYQNINNSHAELDSASIYNIQTKFNLYPCPCG